jgi:methyltransferase (TIGR00027 family)
MQRRKSSSHKEARRKKMSEKNPSDQILGSTARWTAGVRARESLREDHLFHDRWAAALAGKEGEEWAEHRSGDNGVSITIRTRFFDDFLQRVTGQDAIRQVVLMAAGLDMRAFRLTWPERTQLFELDQPQVLEYKEQVLTAAGAQPTCERKTIAVDLTAAWRESLLTAGFHMSHSSVWLLEGFLLYLPQEQIAYLLDDITSLAVPGSWLGFDIINGAILTSPWTRPWVETLANAGTPWIGTIDDPEADLSARGWQTSLTQFGEEEAHFGRWPYPVMPRTLPNMPRTWLVTAQKKEMH